MFKKVFYLLIIFLNLKGISQNKNHLNFEEKLHEFRFSLHEHLNNINPNKLFIFEFQKNDSLIILMQDFELKHKKEIKKYISRLVTLLTQNCIHVTNIFWSQI